MVTSIAVAGSGFGIEDVGGFPESSLGGVDRFSFAKEFRERSCDFEGFGKSFLEEPNGTEKDANECIAHAFPEVGGGEHLEVGDSCLEDLDDVLPRSGDGGTQGGPEEVHALGKSEL